MSKNKKKTMNKPASGLSLTYKKYPDVLDAVNKLADVTDRNPHNALNQAMKAITLVSIEKHA